MMRLALISIVVGFAAGFFFLSAEYLQWMDGLVDAALAVLLFGVGIDLGRTRGLFRRVRAVGLWAVIIPLSIAGGTLIGAIGVGRLLGLEVWEAAAVGSGFGWYSLSAVLIAQTYDVSLGALAFLTNVLREVLAVLVIPLVAARLGKIVAVAPGGATAMDVTLPIIAKSTDAETALLAFISGVVLSMMVPAAVPFFLRLAAG